MPKKIFAAAGILALLWASQAQARPADPSRFPDLQPLQGQGDRDPSAPNFQGSINNAAALGESSGFGEEGGAAEAAGQPESQPAAAAAGPKNGQAAAKTRWGLWLAAAVAAAAGAAAYFINKKPSA